MVVWGHCGNSYFCSSLYYTHLPLLLMLTGYLVYIRNKCDNPFKSSCKSFKAIIYPYITALLLYMFWDVLNIYAFKNGATFLDTIKGFLSLDMGTCWYLPALFFGEIVANFTLNITHRWNKKSLLIVMVIFLFIAELIRTHLYGDCMTYSELGFTDSLNAKNTIKMKIFLEIGRSLYFAFFIILGYSVYPLFNKMLLINEKIRIFASATVSIFLYFLLRNFPLPDLHWLKWENTLQYLLFSFSICSSLTILFMSINKRLLVLEYLGTRSLEIMIVHEKIMFSVSWPIIVGLRNTYPFLLSVLSNNTMVSVINMILTIFLSLIIIEGINKIIPNFFRLSK